MPAEAGRGAAGAAPALARPPARLGRWATFSVGSSSTRSRSRASRSTPPRRGRRVVKDRLEDDLANLRAEEVRRVTLEAREPNLAARALYAAQGFAIGGVRRRYCVGAESALRPGAEPQAVR